MLLHNAIKSSGWSRSYLFCILTQWFCRKSHCCDSWSLSWLVSACTCQMSEVVWFIFLWTFQESASFQFLPISGKCPLFISSQATIMYEGRWLKPRHNPKRCWVRHNVRLSNPIRFLGWYNKGLSKPEECTPHLM